MIKQDKSPSLKIKKSKELAKDFLAIKDEKRKKQFLEQLTKVLMEKAIKLMEIHHKKKGSKSVAVLDETFHKWRMFVIKVNKADSSMGLREDGLFVFMQKFVPDMIKVYNSYKVHKSKEIRLKSLENRRYRC